MNRKGRGTPGLGPGVRVWRSRADREGRKRELGETHTHTHTPRGGERKKQRTEKNTRAKWGMNERERENQKTQRNRTEENREGGKMGGESGRGRENITELEGGAVKETGE